MRPLHIPLAADPADRLAAIADALEAAAAPVRAFPLAVRTGAAVRAHVVLVMPDRGREALSPDDARLLARVLADGAAWPGARDAAVRLHMLAFHAQLEAGMVAMNRSLASRLAEAFPGARA